MRVPLAAFVLLHLLAASSQARAQVRATLNQRYSDTLDLVFSLNEGECRWTHYQVKLRFLPSFQKESQIVLCQRFDGETIAFNQSLSPSDQQVWGAVISAANGERTPAEIAREFHAQTRKCEVASDLTKQWMQEILSLPLNPPPFEGKFMTDGVGYELIVEAGTNWTWVAVQGPREDVPLITWMNKVKKALDSAPTSTR